MRDSKFRSSGLGSKRALGIVFILLLFLSTACNSGGSQAEHTDAGEVATQTPDSTSAESSASTEGELDATDLPPRESAESNAEASAPHSPLVTSAPEGTTASPTATSEPVPTFKSSATPKSTSTSKPSATPKPTLSPDQAKTKQKIDADYKPKFAVVQTSCQAVASDLTGEVKAYIDSAKDSDKKLTLLGVQQHFIGKINAAEAGCNQKFNAVLSAASHAYEAAGLDASYANAWKSQYEKSKAQARSQAMSQILSAWQSR